MARGFLAGAVWGTVASVAAVGALSVISDPPDIAAPLADVPEVEAAVVPDPVAPAVTEATDLPSTTPDQAAPPPDAVVESPDVIEDADRAGRLPEPETDIVRPDATDTGLTDPDAPDAVTSQLDPPRVPTVGAAPDALEAAETVGGLPGVDVSTDAPVMPSGQGDAPSEATPDAPPQADASPAQPPIPAVPTVDAPLVPQDQPVASEAMNTVEAEETAPETTDATQEVNEPNSEDLAQADQDGPAIGTPGTSFLSRDGAVPENRLPRVGDVPDEPVEEVETGALTPLVANAADVEVAADLPRIAVILIDDGQGPLGPDSLGAFPFPVSFAIAPSHPDAAAAALAYRELGFEVLAIADLPAGATASDVEVSLEGLLDSVPQAVAVIESSDGGLDGGREAVAQAASYLARSGHGLVLMPKGLNTAEQLAEREGVPAATLFRDFDGDGQDANMIRRTLDQAAFRARQDGAVTMMGRLRADTISALVLWGLQDRTDSIAMVPISVVLREANEE